MLFCLCILVPTLRVGMQLGRSAPCVITLHTLTDRGAATEHIHAEHGCETKYSHTPYADRLTLNKNTDWVFTYRVQRVTYSCP